MLAICIIDALRAALSACGITPNTFSHQPLQFVNRPTQQS
jgi:hypothetical protein